MTGAWQPTRPVASRLTRATVARRGQVVALAQRGDDRENMHRLLEYGKEYDPGRLDHASALVRRNRAASHDAVE